MAIGLLRQSKQILKCEHIIQRQYLFDFQDVQGQDAIIEFIVAGGHNLFMLHDNTMCCINVY